MSVKTGCEIAVVACLVLAGTAHAHAQPAAHSAAATAQFDKGRALMKSRKYADACAAFEASQKLDPQNGTLYNLAGCYTHLGKLASAWAVYKELAQVDTNGKRKKDAAKQATALDKRLPRLQLKAATPPPGLAVTLDGVDVSALVGSDSPVDLGTHEVRATAPRFSDFDTTVEVTDEGKSVTVAIELAPAKREPIPAPAPAHPTPAQPEPTRPVPVASTPDAPMPVTGEPPRSHRRRYGVIVAAGGGALVATGLVFGSLANGKWSDAKKLCGSDLTCDSDADLKKGNQLTSDARAQANLSTALVAGGAVAIGVGVVLFVTAPHAESASRTTWRITPAASPRSMGLVLDGSF